MAINNKYIELQLNQLSWMAEFIRKIIHIRGLMMEVINEYEDNFLKQNKLRKPSHLIREKKMISISKVMHEQRESFQKYFLLLSLDLLSFPP